MRVLRGWDSPRGLPGGVWGREGFWKAEREKKAGLPGLALLEGGLSSARGFPLSSRRAGWEESIMGGEDVRV